MCEQKPTISFSGWLPNGIKTYWTMPVDGTQDDYNNILAYTNNLLAKGLTLDDPAFGKLEAGEGREQVGYIVRRSQKNNSDNTVTPVIDVYPTPEATKLKFMSIYLDTADDVLAFEKAFGLKLAALPVLPGKKSIERDEQDFTQYVIKVTGVVSAVYKANPRYNPEETDLTKKKPKRLFVKWETATPQPAAAPAAVPAVEIPTPVVGDDWETEQRRKAPMEHVNELVTIYKATYTPTHGGNGAPSWIAYAHDINNVQLPIIVGERGVKLVKQAGHEWPMTDGNEMDIGVITELVDGKRRIKSVQALDGSMVSETPRNAPNANVDANNVHSDVPPAWIYDRVMLLQRLGQHPDVAKVSYQERGATVDKMHHDDEFAKVSNLDSAVTMVVNRLKGHRTAKVPA